MGGVFLCCFLSPKMSKLTTPICSHSFFFFFFIAHISDFAHAAGDCLHLDSQHSLELTALESGSLLITYYFHLEGITPSPLVIMLVYFSLYGGPGKTLRHENMISIETLI